ncbi:ABC transporter substrate-binding protein [Actinomadura macrotermitis]|uniref:Solute-binding protein family 3/N-terminal domain-containing protein n=1 Tax=Actinomadura macrotermitis TaxID=2585200 RepID=A0A7K0BND0_9ACTN|nr:ABC transporter substrate-binding protein [Actinomadura macrotermitis]MQY02681.1 hypothetical protein [Actinomadura macrotermitis]
MRARRKFPTVIATAVAFLLAVTGCALEEGPGSGGGTKDGRTVVRVGYLHTVAVDAHLWLGLAKGLFAKHGLEVKLVKFDTGIAESQALTGGSIDVAVMGAVLSNFPARGQGKVFLLNGVEYDTAQLWVRKDSGIRSVADLAGKKVATTQGTTGHVFLHTALKSEGVDPAKVTVVNSPMPAAVNALISGAVPAAAIWVPFDQQIRKSLPDARLITSAKRYYPKATVADGWVANNAYHAKNRATLTKLAAAWLDVNRLLVGDTAASLNVVHQQGYKNDATLQDVTRNYGFGKSFGNEQWAAYYRDGTAAGWIGQVTRTFVELGGLPEYRDPKTFFDTQIFLDAYNASKGS